MALIEEKSYFVSLHDGHEDLLKEHLIVLDCAGVEFQHGARLAITIGDGLAERLEELSLAQTFSTIQEYKWYSASLLIGFRVEAQLIFDFGLSNEVVKHVSKYIGVEFKCQLKRTIRVLKFFDVELNLFFRLVFYYSIVSSVDHDRCGL